MSTTQLIAEERREMRETKVELKQIERQIGGIARIARLMTEKQLAPYEALATKHALLEKKLKALTDELFDLLDKRRG